jgi:hypothetical protein
MKALPGINPTIYLLGVIFFAAITVSGQSGRRVAAPATAPSQPVTVSTPVPPSDAYERVTISPVTVVGTIVHPYTYLKTSYLDSALKECVNALKMRSVDATAGGKLKLEAAEELAKRETRNTVLWIGFVVKDDGLGNMIFDEVDYVVLLPRTGKVLTRGSLEPGTLSPAITSGGVLRLPRQGATSSISRQMKMAAAEIVQRLRIGG